MAKGHTSRRGGAGRAVFWLIALAVIGGLAYIIYQKKQPPTSENKPVGDQLAAYMAGQYTQGWDPSMDGSFTVKELSEVEQAGNNWFGQHVTLAEIQDSGLSFRGAREVEVPGPPDPNLQPGRSAHYRLETDGTKGPKGVRVSLFLQKYVLPKNEDGTDVLAVRTSYTLKKDAAMAAGAPDILVYRQGGLVFYLVTDQPGGYDLVKAAYQIPDPIGPY